MKTNPRAADSLVNKSQIRVLSSISCVLLMGALIGSAQADLGERSSQTELQSNTGSAIQTIWSRLRDLENLSGDPQELFFICRRVLQSANGLDNTDDTRFSLGLSEAELNAALQQLTGEELASVRSFATELSSGQSTNVSARLAALRTGAPGAGASVLNLQRGGGQLVADTVATAPYWNPRGGAAGSDSGLIGRWGTFINGNISTGEKDDTAREDGFDFDTYGLTAGVDYRFMDNLVAGIALGYSNVDSDFDRSGTVAGGDVSLDGYSISAYGTYYVERFYFDAIIGYGRNDYDLTRRIFYTSNSTEPGSDATARADTDGTYFNVGVGGGYEFTQGSLTYGPYARLSYLDLDIDGYTEKGAGPLNLEVDRQDAQSLMSVFGGQVAYTLSQSFGVVIPHARLEWIHEFDDEADTIHSRYIAANGFISNEDLIANTDNPDKDYAALAVGVSTLFRGGTQAFLQYETWLGLKDIEEHIVTAGVRFEF